MKAKRWVAFLLALVLLAGCARTHREDEKGGKSSRGGVLQAIQTADSLDEFLKKNESARDQNYENMAESLKPSTDKLFQVLRDEKHDTVFSPLSLQVALSMLREGSSGQARKELDAFLGGGTSSLEDYKNLLADVQRDEKADKTYLNNMILISPDKVQDEEKMETYAKNLANYYRAEIYKANFKEEEKISNFVHDWVKENTKGVMEHSPIYDPKTMMVLLNTIYFKGDWVNPFDEEDTKEGPFYTPEGKRECDLMHLYEENFEYTMTEKGIGVVLPIGIDKSMVVYMPRDWEAYQSQISLEDLNPTLWDQGSASINLTFPKYLTKSESQLMDHLKELGLESLKDVWENDIGLRDAAIYSILHKASFESSEEGVEAAALTEVVVGDTVVAPPEEVVDLVFDHPFIYGVFTSDHLPLFLGQYTGIEAEN